MTDDLLSQFQSLQLKLAERDTLAARVWALESAVCDLFAEHKWPEGGDIDAWAFQEWAIRHGFLRPEQRESFCAEDCNCAEYHGDPSGGFTCYRKAEFLLAAPSTPATEK